MFTGQLCNIESVATHGLHLLCFVCCFVLSCVFVLMMTRWCDCREWVGQTATEHNEKVPREMDEEWTRLVRQETGNT